MSINVPILAEDVSSALNTHLDIFNLYHKLINLVSDRISFEDYMVISEEDFSKTEDTCIEIDWDTLKRENLSTYAHEKAHYDVWRKYNIGAQLFKHIATGNYFVIDTDDHPSLKSKNIDGKKWLSIQVEAARAPFKNKSVLSTRYVMDVILCEICSGSLKDFTFNSILETLDKYKWE